MCWFSVFLPRFPYYERGFYGLNRSLKLTARTARPASVRFFSDEKHPVPVLTEGAPDGTVATSLNQTAGKSYEQYHLMEQGYNRFNKGPLVAPFGTQKEPVQVLSAFDSRIVGCVGGKTKDCHDVNWMLVKKDRKTLCVMCGQFFTLISNEGEVLTEIGPNESVDSNVEYYDN